MPKMLKNSQRCSCIIWFNIFNEKWNQLTISSKNDCCAFGQNEEAEPIKLKKKRVNYRRAIIIIDCRKWNERAPKKVKL